MSAQKSSSSRTKKRLLILDDHPMLREGLAQLINNEPDLTVCAEAGTGQQAIELANKSKPDLLLADISLPDKNGLEVIKQLHEFQSGLSVLVISMHDESLYAERAIRAGAQGYVMKSEPARIVRGAIVKVLGGDIFLSQKMSTSVLTKLMSGKTDAPVSPVEQLSDRELEVFQLIGQGMPTRQIAEELDLTIPTIHSFRNRIKEKLKLKSSTELLLHAMQWFRESVVK